MLVENNSGAKPRPIDDHLMWFAKQRAKKAAAAKPRHVCIKDTGIELVGTTLENWGVSPCIR